MARLTANSRFDQTRMDLNVLSRNRVDVEFFNDVNLAIDGQPIEDVILISYVDGGFDSSAYLGGQDFRLGSDDFSIMGTLNAVAIAAESAGVTIQDWRISGLETPLSDLVTAAESAGQADDRQFISRVLSGSDVFRLSGGDDKAMGLDGNDRMIGKGGDDSLQGNDGADTILGDGGMDVLWGGKGFDVLRGGSGADTVIGGGGQDQLLGGSGDDRLEGHVGSDQLTGGRGNDLLIGGRGRDLMTGGQGADVFKFNMLADSGRFAAGADVIQDFGVGRDRIDLSAIDADMGVKGNQAFTWSLDGLSGQAGQLAMLIDADRTRVMIDIDGDATADMMISLIGRLDLGADDFIL